MRIHKSILIAFVLAGGMLFGEAAARPSQEAQADNWEFFISPQDVYCEGCCSPRMVCCSSTHPCRIEPI